MHRSRLTAALFDVPGRHFEAEVAFWGAALGARPVVDEDDPDYASLEGPDSDVEILVQRIGGSDPARLHVDIETDDVEAEAARLEELGATRVRMVDSWWIMRDPAGLVFCVVEVQSAPEDFAEGAATWGEPPA